MAIVNYDFYTFTFYGESIAECEFEKYAARAQDAILLLCKNRIKEESLADFPPLVQEAVKKAICAQIEYLSLYGLDIANTGRSGGGFTVGKVRIEGQGGTNGAVTGAKSMISPLAISYLEQTGLLDPSVPFADYVYVDIWRLR